MVCHKGTPYPRLLRVRDLFGKLVVKAKGGLRIDGTSIFDAAEGDRTMSIAEANDLSEVMDRVKTWSPTLRMALARRILESVDVPAGGPLRRGRPVRELIGLGAGDDPAPDDDQVRQWIDEHRMEKYG